MDNLHSNIYEKQLLLQEIGVVGQSKLTAAKVAVIGAGGLGCPVIKYLSAAGVGEIHIIDGDSVSLSNIHRQTLYGVNDVESKKVIVAENRISEWYPHLKIVSIPEFITPSNAPSLLSKVDIVVDCTDNFAARYLINDACVQLDIPFIFGAIHKFEGQVAVFNNGNSPSYRCLFPEYPKEENQSNCGEVGVLGILPGIIGTIQATEVIKWIVGMDGLLDSHLLSYQAIHHEMRKIKLPKRNFELCKKVKEQTLQWHPDYCQSERIISWSDFLSSHEFLQVIDVREANETPESPDFTTHKIPTSLLEKNWKQLNANLKTAIFCQSGVRSQKATVFLQEKGFKTIYSIENGMNKFPRIKETQL